MTHPGAEKRRRDMSTSSSNPQVGVRKHFTSSILLWMRTDQPRQKGMDHWKGPHSGIIAASPGLEEYRQIHLAETNPGLWPATTGVETRIPADRKVDGVAEVTFQSALSPLKGRTQTKLAFKDEVNVFRRTLLYAGAPGTSRWYDVAGPGRDRRRPSRRLPAPQGRRQWPRVPQGHQEGPGPRAHRHRRARRSCAPRRSCPGTRRRGTPPTSPTTTRPTSASTPRWSSGSPTRPPGQRSSKAPAIEQLSQMLAPVASAIHAYDVVAALTYVKGGEILPHYQE